MSYVFPTMRYRFTSARMAVIEKMGTFGENVRKLEPSRTASGSVSGAAAVANVWRFLKS